jgi:hypothetical protein
MPAFNTYKSPAQRRGERYLLDINLLASPRALKNIESVKRKTRAIRLKEEYQQKYLSPKDIIPNKSTKGYSYQKG